MTAINFPSTPSTGDIHNAANGLQYIYDGVKWKSQGAYDSGVINAQKLDSITSSFNGTLTTFDLKINNLTVKPSSAESVQIVLAGVLQEPQTAYTINTLAGQITFTAAPTTGTEFFGVLLSRLPVSGVGDGSVTNTKIADNAAIEGSKIQASSASNAGTMSASDFSKLDGIATSANNYSHPTTAGNIHIPTGGSSGQVLKYLSSGTAQWGTDENTTYTVGDGGLTQKNFTTTLKSKLDNIDDNANNFTFTHPTGTHVPTGGTSGQVLKIDTDGTTRVWGTDNSGAGAVGGATGVDFNDNVKIRFGNTAPNNPDLEIYHDGSNSIISDAGTGGLLLYGSDIILHKAGTSDERLADFAQDGAARLYFDAGTHSTAKLATTASGVTVDGTVSATAFSGDGSSLTGIGSGLTTEAVQDIVGAMFTSNTETNITATYQDDDGTIDLVVSSSFTPTSSNISAAFGDGANLVLGAADGDGDDALKLYYGSSSGGTYGVLTADTGVHLQFDGSPKFETQSAGVKWHGDLFCEDSISGDVNRIRLGNTHDLELYHDSNNSIIDATGTGALLLYGSDIIFHEQSDPSHKIAEFSQDSSTGCKLYYDNSPKLQTTGSGITVTGNISLATTGATVDGRDVGVDGIKLDNIAFGAEVNVNADWNSSSGDSRILNKPTIPTNNNQLTNGAGYITTPTASQINAQFGDNGNLILGTGSGDDTLKLYYDGTRGKITSDNGVHIQQDGANKLEVGSSGTKWIGDLFCDDQQYIKLGTSADMTLRHDASGSTDYGVISVGNSSQFRLQSFNNIELMCGDGSGGLDWSVFGSANSWTALYYQGNMRFYTGSSGAGVIGQLIPNTNDLYDLGNINYKWDDVYATNGTIQTSDRNEKNTIVDSDLGLPFVNKLKPVSYKYNGKTRTHYGLIAQDVETTLSDISKSTTEFAGFIKTDVAEELYTKDHPEVFEKTKNIGDVKTAAHTSYGLRYGEFIAPLIKAVQELSTEVETLKTKVAELEAG